MNNPLPKLILFTATVLMFTSAAAKRIPGQIIDKEGRTIEVTFNIPFGFLSSRPNFEKLQYRVAYYDGSNTKKILKPDEAQEIVFSYNRMEVRMLSRVNNVGNRGLFHSNTHIFLHLQIDGKLKLFNFYFSQNTPGFYNPSTGAMTGGMMYAFENYVLQVGDEALMQPRGIAFRKDMMAYLFDCPEVVRMIENRELRKGDLELIVMEYNRKCSR